MAVKETPVMESRLLAALAHGSVVMQGMGIVVGILVYINQRGKSQYAAYQALQAAVYQLINLIIVGALWVIWGVFYAFAMIPIINSSANNAAPPPLFWISFGSMVIPFIVMLVVVVAGLWAALRTWQGKEFRYPVLGHWLEHSGLWENHASQ